MDKDRIDELAKDPKFIPGIYNYCDRWCERCAFTSRCLNYELDEEESGDPEARDINNKAFWNKLTETLSVTLEMMREKAKELGVNLDATDSEETAKENKRIREKAMEQPYCLAAKKYNELVSEWFRANKEKLEAKGDELVAQAQAGIPGTNPDVDAVRINDCLEVIRWYQYQIYVKLCRAAIGAMETDPDELEFNMHDANGSAKVALIGIDRSVAAWAGLLPHFPDQEDGILDLLVILKRLLPQVESIFPNSRTFQRPGLDATG